MGNAKPIKTAKSRASEKFAWLTISTVLLSGCSPAFKSLPRALQAASLGIRRLQLTSGPRACNVRDYGAIGDGRADDTAAIQAAANKCRVIYLPTTSSCYIVNGTINFSGHGHGAVGDEGQQTCVKNLSASAPTFVSQGGVLGTGVTIYGARFANLRLTRGPTASSGADGLDVLQVTDDVSIYNVSSDHNYDGFGLGVTGWSVVRNVTAASNVRHGLNIGQGGNPQWHLYNIAANMNGGDGFHLHCIGTLQATVGEYIALETHGNGGAGFKALGSENCPIQGLRIIGANFSNDGGYEVYLDTFGYGHILQDVTAQGGNGVFVSSTSNPALDSIEFVYPNISGSRGHGLEIHSVNWGILGGSISGNAGTGIAAENGNSRILGVNTSSNGNYGIFANPNKVASMRIVGGQASGNGLGNIYCDGCQISSADPQLSRPILPPAPPNLAGISEVSGPGICNVRDFGAKGDGATDDAAAFQAAANACPVIYIPATSTGTCYVVGAEIKLHGDGQGAVGDSQYSSCVSSSLTSGRVLVAGSGKGGRFANLRVAHQAPATSGGTGLDIRESTSSVIVFNMRFENNFDAVSVAGSQGSALVDIYALYNKGHGINIGVSGQNGWQMFDIATGFNGGDGFHIECNGSGRMVPGAYVSLETFANVGYGFRVQGSPSCSIDGVKWIGGFLGQDGDFGKNGKHEVYLDTYNNFAGSIGHVFENLYVDVSSVGAFFSANNAGVSINTPMVNGTVGHGIVLLAQSWAIQGGSVTYSQGGTGIAAEGGSGRISGNMVLSNDSYGIYVNSAAGGVTLQGIDARSNGLGQIYCGANCANLDLAGSQAPPGGNSQNSSNTQPSGSGSPSDPNLDTFYQPLPQIRALSVKYFGQMSSSNEAVGLQLQFIANGGTLAQIENFFAIVARCWMNAWGSLPASYAWVDAEMTYLINGGTEAGLLSMIKSISPKPELKSGSSGGTPTPVATPAPTPVPTPAPTSTARELRSQLIRQIYTKVFGYAPSKETDDYFTDIYNPAAGWGCRGIAHYFVAASPLRAPAAAAVVASDANLINYINMLYQAILPSWTWSQYNTATIAGWRAAGSITMDQLDGIFLDNDEFKGRCSAAGMAF